MAGHPSDEFVGGWRDALPATRRIAFLNTGTFGPLPTAAGEVAARMSVEDAADGRTAERSYTAVIELAAALRQRIGGFVGVAGERVALTRSTTEGLNTALAAQRLGAGDRIVTTSAEHPGLLVPLALLARRVGVVIDVVEVGRGDGDVVGALVAACTARTRLIAVSHVLWTTGAVVDLAALAAAAPVPVIADGAQGAGHVAVDVDALGVLAYALPGQKWLCGPDGTGALAFGRGAADAWAVPAGGGYWSQTATDPDAATATLHPNARRFELGPPPAALLAGWAAGLDLLGEIGAERGRERAFSLARTLTGALAERGLDVVTPPDRAASIVTAAVPGGDAEAAAVACRRAGVEVRALPGTPWIRASVGPWNTAGDLDRYVAALDAHLRAA